MLLPDSLIISSLIRDTEGNYSDCISSLISIKVLTVAAQICAPRDWKSFLGSQCKPQNLQILGVAIKEILSFHSKEREKTSQDSNSNSYFIDKIWHVNYRFIYVYKVP